MCKLPFRVCIIRSLSVQIKDSDRIELMYSEPPLLLTGSPQYQESSPKMFVRQGLFPDQHDETLPDDEDEEDEDDRSMVALETELQKYLHED